MRLTTRLLTGLLVVLLGLSNVGPAGFASAGANDTHVWRGIGPWAATILALAIDPATPTTIYAGAGGTYGLDGGGVYKSTNGGGNWIVVNTGMAIHDGLDPYILSLAIDQATPSTLYAGTNTHGIFKSTNGGENWHAVNSGLTTYYPFYALAIDPAMPATLYAATYYGSKAPTAVENGAQPVPT
jgi:hypothetical protein